MKYRYGFIGISCFFSFLFSQETDSIVLKKYKEDQFYIGTTYNVIKDLPPNTFQNNFSYGINIGFIRDIPFNKACNRGIGIGIGYATNSYFSNLVAMPLESSKIEYSKLSSELEQKFIRNKIETHLIEFPFEFRFRTSTYDSPIFWRVYLGFKLGYVFENRSKLILTDSSFSFWNPDVNRLRYNTYVAFNFKGRWNIHIEYDLNSVLDSEKATFINRTKTKEVDLPIDIRGLKVGIRFYLL